MEHEDTPGSIDDTIIRHEQGKRMSALAGITSSVCAVGGAMGYVFDIPIAPYLLLPGVIGGISASISHDYHEDRAYAARAERMRSRLHAALFPYVSPRNH